MWRGLIWARLLQAGCFPNGALRINQQRPVWQFDRQHSSLCSWLQLSSNLVPSALIMSGQIWSRPNTCELMVCFDAVWLEGMGCHLLTHWNINHSRKSGLKDDRDRVRRQRRMRAPVGFRFVGFGWSLLSPTSQPSAGVRSASPERQPLPDGIKTERLAEWGREDEEKEQTKKESKEKGKEGAECQDKDVLSVILAPAVCPVKAWKGCCLSTILFADIQNPISGCVGAGFLSDSGPFVRRAINEEHWQR